MHAGSKSGTATNWSLDIDFSYISRSHTVYLSGLYAADEGLHGWNVLQLVVDWFRYVFAHNQFAYTLHELTIHWNCDWFCSYITNSLPLMVCITIKIHRWSFIIRLGVKASPIEWPPVTAYSSAHLLDCGSAILWWLEGGDCWYQSYGFAPQLRCSTMVSTLVGGIYVEMGTEACSVQIHVLMVLDNILPNCHETIAH